MMMMMMMMIMRVHTHTHARTNGCTHTSMDVYRRKHRSNYRPLALLIFAGYVRMGVKMRLYSDKKKNYVDCPVIMKQ